MTIIFNGEPREIASGMTVSEFLRELNVVATRVAVEVNLEVVPRGNQAKHQLREGDRLELVTLVGGG